MSKELHSETKISFDNAGDFLGWWFETKTLDGKALQTFERYYANYYRNFDGYLRQIWTDRHLELDREIEAVKDRDGLRIMDLGSGIGSVSLYLAGKLKGRGEVLGVDINSERLFCARERQKALEQAMGHKLNCDFKKSNVLSLEEENKFDLIYLEETLHHMEPRSEVVEKIANLIKDDGILIISDVNACNPFMQLALFMKRGWVTVRKMVGEDGKEFLYGVERILSAEKTARLFMEKGLRVKTVRHFRLASSALGKLADRIGFDLAGVEKKACGISFLARFFSVHFNIVLSK